MLKFKRYNQTTLFQKRDAQSLLLGIVLLFLLPNILLSNQPNISFNNVSTEDNPDFAYILSLYQDSEGYMWIGTYNGLYKYDGVNYTTFIFSDDTNSISNSVVHAIAEDREHNLWFGTEYGLNKYNIHTGKFTVYKNVASDSNSLQHDHVRTLFIDNKGIVWIGTYGGGVNYFNPETSKFTAIKTTNSVSGLKSDRINCFLAENDSAFWIGTENGGISILNTKTMKIETFNSLFLQGATISELYKDSKGNIWIGTWRDGLYLFNPSDSSFTRQFNDMGREWTAISVVEDIEGNLWIGTFEKGLIKYNSDLKEHTLITNDLNNSNSLLSNSVWKLFIDKSQILWVGTFGGGFGRYDKYRHKFNNFNRIGKTEGGLSHKTVRALCEIGDNIWIGTVDGINKYNKAKEEITEYYLAGQSISVSKIAAGRRNDLWIASGLGLYHFNLATKKSKLIFDKNLFPGINQDYVTTVDFDPHGNLWFSVYDEGLFYFPKEEIESGEPDLSKIIQYKHTERGGNNISADVIWDILCVSDDEIWLATNTQIDRFSKKNNKFDHFGYYAHSVFFTNQPGILWVGSLGKGLMKLEKSSGKITNYSTKNGLESDIIQSIEGDNDGNLWISTNKGISKFNPFNEKFKNYDLADGLVSKQYSLNASASLSTGELAYGSSNGFVIFVPEMIKDNPYPVEVKITDIKVLNTSILDAKSNSVEHQKYRQTLQDNNELIFSYKDKIISFNFVALSYSAINKIEYAYMLEGFEQDWVYTDAENRSATYTNLEGGEYVFKVKASNPDGIWNDQVESIIITIKPPFWKTLFFKLTSTFVILLALLLLYRNRIHAVKVNALNKYNLERQLREKEVMRLNNEKLDSELDYKKKELALSTLYNIRKNEDLYKLQEELMLISKDVIPKNRARIQKLIKEVEVSLNENDSWAHFEQNFNILHDEFLKRFSTEYPKLTHKDLRICAFIRMNIDNKEIARTLNITPESLGVSRTRIRKKIGLDKDVYLNDFILRF